MADLSKLDLNPEEIKRLKKAMDNPEFMNLLADYTKEISDPNNKQKYDMEIQKLESMKDAKGMGLVIPQPGFLFKAEVMLKVNKKDLSKRAYVNMCSSDTIADADLSSIGKDWDIPYNVAPPRKEKGKGGKLVNVYDVLFGTKSIDYARNDPRFKTVLVESAAQGIEGNFGDIIVITSVRFSKKSSYGQLSARFLSKSNPPQESPQPLLLERPRQSRTQVQPAKEPRSQQPLPETPKYEVVTDPNDGTKPSKLVIRIELPRLSSTKTVDLEIAETRLLLIEENNVYNLDISLPHPVDKENGVAKFIKAKHVLAITLPVK